MKNRILIATVLTLFLGLVSCKKTDCQEPTDSCQAACAMNPMKGFCGTPPVEYKYYFNATTGQCEIYIHVGDDIPFETLQECESCGCASLPR